MTTIHAHADRPNEPGRIVPVQGTRVYASDDAPRVLPLAERLQVERRCGRLCVTITRRYPRLFCLSDDEAQYLAAQLAGAAGDSAAAAEPETVPLPVRQARKGGRCTGGTKTTFDADALIVALIVWLAGSGPLHAECSPCPRAGAVA